MNEDQDRTRLDNGPHNLAVLRHMALNVMQKDTTKGSLRGKFMRAGWDDATSPGCSRCSEMRLPCSCRHPQMTLPGRERLH